MTPVTTTIASFRPADVHLIIAAWRVHPAIMTTVALALASAVAITAVILRDTATAAPLVSAEPTTTVSTGYSTKRSTAPAPRVSTEYSTAGSTSRPPGASTERSTAGSTETARTTTVQPATAVTAAATS